MKFVLKGRVNYLPAFTYGKMKDNYAEIDFNYKISDKDKLTINLPEGVIVSDDYAEIKKKIELVKTGMESVNLDSKAGGDSISADNLTLNEVKDAPSSHLLQNAFDAAGVSPRAFTVKKNKKVKEPLRIFYEADESFVANNIVYAEENSEITIIELFNSTSKENLLGVRTRVYLCEGAKVKLVRVNLLSETTDHFDDLGFYLENDAKVELVQLELGAKRSYVGVRTEMVGDNSGFKNSTGYLCKENSLLDMNFVVNERGKKAASNMYASGVLFENAAKIYRGSIDFKEGAKGASGFENESTLLFGENIINKSMPLILCHEADVEGDHGATMGKIDKDILFYIQSRGINKKAAKELMTFAYINAITNRINDKATEERVRKYVSEVFSNE